MRETAIGLPAKLSGAQTVCAGRARSIGREYLQKYIILYARPQKRKHVCPKRGNLKVIGLAELSSPNSVGQLISECFHKFATSLRA